MTWYDPGCPLSCLLLIFLSACVHAGVCVCEQATESLPSVLASLPRPIPELTYLKLWKAVFYCERFCYRVCVSPACTHTLTHTHTNTHQFVRTHPQAHTLAHTHSLPLSHTNSISVTDARAHQLEAQVLTACDGWIVCMCASQAFGSQTRLPCSRSSLILFPTWCASYSCGCVCVHSWMCVCVSE